MTDTKKLKDNHIKVRVLPKEREEIITNSISLEMNVSEYIRYCCLPNEHLTIANVPNFIRTNNLLNDIVHYLDGHTNPQTLNAVKNKIAKYYKGEHYNEHQR